MEFQLFHRLHTLLRSPPRRARQEAEPVAVDGGSALWHLLPSEILVQIFSNFDTLHEKFSISMACRDWFYVMWGTQNHLSLTALPSSATDGALQRIPQLCPRLQSLWLSSGTDLGCQQLVHLTELRSLTLSRCYDITDAAIAAVSLCTSLEECKISRCPVSNESLERLRHLCGLKRLILSGFRDLDAQAVTPLQDIQPLEEISIHGSHQLEDDGLAALSHLPHLRFIDVSWCARIHGTFLSEGFPALEVVNLQWNYLVTDETLKLLSKHEQLKSINVSGCEQVSTEGIRALKKLTRLEELVLGDLLGLQSDAIQVLTQSAYAPTLKRLVLRYGVGLTDDAFAHFDKLTSLEYLNIIACLQLRDDALQHISGARALEELVLSGNFFTSAGVRPLTTLPRLQVVEATDCPRLTDRSLESFASIPSLKRLNLSGCKRITPTALAYLRDKIFDGSCEVEC